MSCALAYDTKQMFECQLKNSEYYMYSRIAYEKIQKMGLSLLEREQEYLRMIDNMPHHLRKKDDPLYKPLSGTTVSRMRPPVVTFDDETDLDNYYEGSDQMITPGTQRLTFMRNRRITASSIA